MSQCLFASSLYLSFMEFNSPNVSLPSSSLLYMEKKRSINYEDGEESGTDGDEKVRSLMTGQQIQLLRSSILDSLDPLSGKFVLLTINFDMMLPSIVAFRVFFSWLRWE
ncbi:hypothetical protein NE237_007365 [Protea cynaroides]|uniref:Uncharacterized protein n=1 Tax=Protea cynaroides TaxID=273540 RepID=A0A9Q0KPX2_9MAGN|nr:hypothetical protein NE237_007365 [Protea cynaroides]